MRIGRYFRNIVIIFIVCLGFLRAQTQIDIAVKVSATTLSADMTLLATTFTVTSVAKLPSNLPALVMVGQELIRICSVSGSTVTVCLTGPGRGAGGTSATGHTTGAVVSRFVNTSVPQAGVESLQVWMAGQTTGSPPVPKYATEELAIRAGLQGFWRAVVNQSPSAAVVTAKNATTSAQASEEAAVVATLP